MKKHITSLVLIATLTGCATHSLTTKTTDTSGATTVTQDKTSQSDNAALTFLGETIKVGGDIIGAVLPPFIPVIVSGLTSPVTTAPSK